MGHEKVSGRIAHSLTTLIAASLIVAAFLVMVAPAAFAASPSVYSSMNNGMTAQSCASPPCSFSTATITANSGDLMVFVLNIDVSGTASCGTVLYVSSVSGTGGDTYTLAQSASDYSTPNATPICSLAYVWYAQVGSSSSSYTFTFVMKGSGCSSCLNANYQAFDVQNVPILVAASSAGQGVCTSSPCAVSTSQLKWNGNGFIVAGISTNLGIGYTNLTPGASLTYLGALASLNNGLGSMYALSPTYASPSSMTGSFTWNSYFNVAWAEASVAFGYSPPPVNSQTSIVYTTVYMYTTITQDFVSTSATGSFVAVSVAIANWAEYMMFSFLPVALFTFIAFSFLRHGKVDDDRAYLVAFTLILFVISGLSAVILPTYVPIFAAVLSLSFLFGVRFGQVGSGSQSPTVKQVAQQSVRSVSDDARRLRDRLRERIRNR